MKFKLAHYREQLEQSPDRLRQIANYMDAVAQAQFKKEIVITCVWDDAPKRTSQVHYFKRAFDARIQYSWNGKEEWLFTKEEAEKIAELVNKNYPREDYRKTCLVHAVDGGRLHFHVQISPKDALIKVGRNKGEKNGILEECV